MVSSLAYKDFDKFFQLIENSFPKDEYRTYDEQKALLDNPAYEIYTYSNDDTLKAFIAVWKFDSFVYIDHFVVDPIHRDNGIGSVFLREAVRIFEKMVCLEVELPNNEVASRRIDFYKRNNFFLNKYPYMQPPISTGRNPVPLLIMTSGRPVNDIEFKNIKEILYSQVYKVKI